MDGCQKSSLATSPPPKWSSKLRIESIMRISQAKKHFPKNSINNLPKLCCGSLGHDQGQKHKREENIFRISWFSFPSFLTSLSRSFPFFFPSLPLSYDKHLYFPLPSAGVSLASNIPCYSQWNNFLCCDRTETCMLLILCSNWQTKPKSTSFLDCSLCCEMKKWINSKGTEPHTIFVFCCCCFLVFYLIF